MKAQRQGLARDVAAGVLALLVLVLLVLWSARRYDARVAARAASGRAPGPSPSSRDTLKWIEEARQRHRDYEADLNANILPARGNRDARTPSQPATQDQRPLSTLPISPVDSDDKPTLF